MEKEIRTVDSELRLIPYYDNYEIAFSWYQDPELCRQVDNRDHVYSMELLKAMYSFLDAHGDCYYIEYQGTLVGDVTLQETGEISIVICKEYQNRHIGRRCILDILKLAEEKEYPEVKANIYSFNIQSRTMFLACGFEKTSEELKSSGESKSPGESGLSRESEPPGESGLSGESEPLGESGLSGEAELPGEWFRKTVIRSDSISVGYSKPV